MFVKVIHETESVIYKKEIYKKGDTFEIDEALAASLVERKYVEPAEPFDGVIDVEYKEVVEEKIEDEAETVKGKFDKEQLMGMDYAEIKKIASDLGIKAVGKKDELIKKICAEEVEIPVEAMITEDELPNTDMPE